MIRSPPLSTWPYEALVTLIERGSIRDWARLATAIEADPWGPVARQVEAYLSYESPYGVGPLLTRAVDRARRETDEADRAEVAAEVGRLIESTGLTVSEVAERIGTSRSRLSTYRSGKVTPSAALMVRLRRVAAALSEPGHV